MRTAFLISLVFALLASPAWAGSKCGATRPAEAQTCQPLAKACCGEVLSACAISKYAPGCPPPHQCLESRTACSPERNLCPPAHQPLQFACITTRTPCIKPVCHKPVVVLTLLDACGSCGKANCTDC